MVGTSDENVGASIVRHCRGGNSASDIGGKFHCDVTVTDCGGSVLPIAFPLRGRWVGFSRAG